MSQLSKMLSIKICRCSKVSFNSVISVNRGSYKLLLRSSMQVSFGSFLGFYFVRSRGFSKS